MIEPNELKIKSVRPNFKELKEGYSNIFSFPQLKMVMFCGLLTFCGVIFFYILPTTIYFYRIFNIIGIFLLFFSFGPFLLILLLQPFFRFSLQFCIFLIELNKQILFGIQYFIFVILEGTLYGKFQNQKNDRK